MCGICGIATWRQRAGDIAGRQSRVRKMVAALAHRGRQASGVATATGATLGAQRLAIRGLADGSQPLRGVDSGVLAVCNGEIDNHTDLRRWLRGRSREVHGTSDVSVIVPLYEELGPRFVERLEGAFAVAVWDHRQQIAVLARDRAGERPLFYCNDETELAFATEVAALSAADGTTLEIDRHATGCYLSTGCFVAPTTPFVGMRKVQAGEVIVLAARAVERHRYWRWPIVDAAKATPSVAAFDEVFRGAVSRQSSADVDFGLLISGGLDSSLIASVARSLEPKRRLLGFTVRMGEPSYDEGETAHDVARRLGITCVDVALNAADLPEVITSLVRLTGEPLADPAWVATALLATAAADHDLRLVLSGEGADELFGGYPTYIGAGIAQHYARLPGLLRRWIAAGVRAIPPSERKVTIAYLMKRFVDGDGHLGLGLHRRWTANFSADALVRLGVGATAPERETDGYILDLVQRYDFETLLGEGLLTKSDRGGMSAAVEIRAPFLDRAVMEFAATLPAPERVSGLTTKRFLKRYAERYMPRSVVHRRKRGLSLPLSRWLRGPLRDWSRDRLAAQRLDEVGIDSRGALGLLAEHELRRADHARGLWALLVLDIWLEWNHDRNKESTMSATAPVDAW